MIKKTEQPLFGFAYYCFDRSYIVSNNGMITLRNHSQPGWVPEGVPTAHTHLAKSLNSMIKPGRCQQRLGACRLRSTGTVHIHPATTITRPCDRSMDTSLVQLQRQRKYLFSRVRIQFALFRILNNSRWRWWRCVCVRERDRVEEGSEWMYFGTASSSLI